MKKSTKNDKGSKMSLREMALEILSGGKEMSAHEVWVAAEERGLTERSNSSAERPETTMAAFLYRSAADGKCGITARGQNPVKFRIAKRRG